jgi:hypothetical protein
VSTTSSHGRHGRIGVPTTLLRPTATGCWLLFLIISAALQPAWGWRGAVRFVLTVCCAVAFALFVHMLGHLLVGLAFGGRVSPPLPAAGGIVWSRPPRRGGAVLTVASGPAANILVAVALPALPGPLQFTAVLAGGCAVIGLIELVPFEHPLSGRLSDGAKIFLPGVRRTGALSLRHFGQRLDQGDPRITDDLLALYRLGAMDARRNFHVLAHLLRRAGRIEELLALHEDEPAIGRPPSEEELRAVHCLSWTVLTVPRLPPAAARTAGRRLERVLALGGPEHGLTHTLALARLRSERPAEVGPLCEAVLAGELTPSERATVLATVALAEDALGRDGRPALRTALTLDPAADLVGEARAKILGDRTRPGRGPVRRTVPRETGAHYDRFCVDSE